MFHIHFVNVRHTAMSLQMMHIGAPLMGSYVRCAAPGAAPFDPHGLRSIYSRDGHSPFANAPCPGDHVLPAHPTYDFIRAPLESHKTLGANSIRAANPLLDPPSRRACEHLSVMRRNGFLVTTFWNKRIKILGYLGWRQTASTVVVCRGTL